MSHFTLMNKRIAILFALPALTASAALISGCTNAEGRFRPIDPLGRMLFDAIDKGPSQPVSNDRSQSRARVMSGLMGSTDTTLKTARFGYPAIGPGRATPSC